MDEFEYLSTQDQELILNTWNALGAFTVNKDTKVYSRGSIVKVDASNGDDVSNALFHNRIIYVLEDYRVDNKTKFIIHWDELSQSESDPSKIAVQGLTLPYFGILPAKWDPGFMPDKNFIPFSFEGKGGELPNVTPGVRSINISDFELETCLTVIGFPFANFQDIEYSKQQIIEYMVRPALQRYYTFRPIVKEQAYGQVAPNQEVIVPFPTFEDDTVEVMGCIPYYTVPSGSMGGTGGRGNPFAYYNTQMMGGASGGMLGSRYGRGLRYPGKMVPGYVGTASSYTSQMDMDAARQGMLNRIRREHWSKEKIDGQWCMHGFTTIGGNINFKWLCKSKDYERIDEDELEVWVRPMIRSEVLNNFYVIRSLVKTDIAGQLDPQVMKTQRDEIETILRPMCNSVATVGAMAIMHGGGN